MDTPPTIKTSNIYINRFGTEKPTNVKSAITFDLIYSWKFSISIEFIRLLEIATNTTEVINVNATKKIVLNKHAQLNTDDGHPRPL